ncbi:MAG: hypothetical protein JXX14_26020 [Deltaproteobacteria bacterium]|nr:hypothetical protein [Deltaproteobacteria bacterium]
MIANVAEVRKFLNIFIGCPPWGKYRRVHIEAFISMIEKKWKWIHNVEVLLYKSVPAIAAVDMDHGALGTMAWGIQQNEKAI